MKKKFLSILALIVAAAMLLGGCSGATPLSFTNAFYASSGTPEVGYNETVVYTVKNVNDYDGLVKDEQITDQLIKYNIEGTFTTQLTVMNRLPDAYSQQITTDLDFSGEGRQHIYYYKTTLDIYATYTVGGEYSNYTDAANVVDNGDGSKTYHDVIVSESFFFTSSQSLSPIWSNTDSRYTYLTSTSAENGQSKINVITVESKSSTTYNSTNYTITSSYVMAGMVDEKIEKTQTKNYTQKTVIDNAQLLFAIRNVELAEDASSALPTVSASYGAPKTLTVKNNGDKQKTLRKGGENSFTYNGQELADNELEIAVKDYSFYLNTTNDAGTPQYLLIQKSASASGKLPAKALIIEYVEPLSIYGSFQRLGALVYTIKSVNV